jgi:filamentous hemagglutinin
MTQVPYTFGNEESPIPLSQLDANFAVTPQFANTAGIVINPAQANITSVGTLTALSVSGNVTGARFTTAGTVTAQGNVTAGNIVTGGRVDAFGTVTGGSFSTAGNVTGSNINGTIVASNITASGTISAVGNISTQSEIVAIGNINTSGYFIGNFQGNIVGNITGVPGSATQVLFNTAGNVDAVGGLTYNKGSNVLTVLGQVSTQTLAVSGLATAPTAPNATSNNQIASTAFVNNQINQYANAVAITAGNITVTNLTANTVTTGLWTIQDFGGTLYFQHTGGNVAKLESNGDFTTIGNVTGFGTL